jgi:hypothetical protein
VRKEQDYRTRPLASSAKEAVAAVTTMPLALAVAAVLAVLLMLAVAMPVTLTMVLGAGVVFKRRGTPQYWFAGNTHRRRRDRIAFLYGE